MMAERESDDMAIVALDSHDEKTDTRRARAFGNFLYGSEVGRSLSHIVETPFFVSSMATVGIQIADLPVMRWRNKTLDEPTSGQ